MEEHNLIKKLKRKVILTFFMITFIIAGLLFFVTNTFQEKRIKQIQENFHAQIENSINHSLVHNTNDYKFRVLEISSNQNIIKYLREKDRNSLYKEMQERWELLKEENKELYSLHFNLPDGTAFLRMHRPDEFGDNIAKDRKTLSHVHKHKKLVTAYETCPYTTAFRIVSPIFYKNEYLGAVDFAIKPWFISDMIKDISGAESVVLVKDNKIDKNFLEIDGFRLDLERANVFIKNIIQSLNPKKIELNEGQIVDYEGKKYLIHIKSLDGFNGDEKLRIVFFHDITLVYDAKSNVQTVFTISFGLLIIAILLLAMGQINYLNSKLLKIYKKHSSDLQSSRDAFESLFELSPNPFHSLDEKGNILLVNQAWVDETGYSKDEVIGESFNKLLTKDSKKVFEENYPRFFKEGKVRDFVCNILKKDNSVINVSFNANASSGDENQKSAFLCVFTNITGFIKQQKELKYKELYSRSIFNAEHDMLITTDGDSMDNANLATLNFTGYGSVYAFKKDHECICDLFEKKDGFLQKEMNGKKWLDHIYDSPLIEHRALIKDHTFQVSAKKLSFDEKNRYLAIFHDITEVEKYQSRLEESEKNLNRAQDISKVGHWVYDIKTNKHFWSKESYKIYELDPDQTDLQPDTYKKYILPEDIKKVEEYEKELQETYKKGQIEFRIKTKDNKIKYIDSFGEFDFDSEGKPLRIFGYMHDISEKVKAQNKLHEKEEIMLIQSRHAAMGEMISMIAHQWRQPISIISMEANNIIADIEFDSIDNETLKKAAQGIGRQTQELSKTIDDFRDFFKPNKSIERVDTKDIFKDTFAIMGKSLDNNSIKVQEEYKGELEIETYPRELLQVVINIIKNAKEALNENSIDKKLISILSYEEKENITITICDNAGGIKEDILNRVFEPYFTTKDESSGTGLGLYMSKTIVEKHLKGKIEVFNKNDGACFIIDLPKNLE